MKYIIIIMQAMPLTLNADELVLTDDAGEVIYFNSMREVTAYKEENVINGLIVEIPIYED